jgi:hypothetical protein
MCKWCRGGITDDGSCERCQQRRGGADGGSRVEAPSNAMVEVGGANHLFSLL